MLQEKAVNQAVIRMGDGDDVGKQLNLVHKGTPDWVTLILTIVIVNTGVGLMYLMLYATLGTLGIIMSLYKRRSLSS